MKRVRELEGVLLRAEGGAAVVLVLVMLALAGYNVVYRNVLVPLQTYWAHSGPPIVREAPEDDAPAKAATGKAETKAKAEDADGFRGAFGAPAEGESDGGGAEDEGEAEDEDEDEAEAEDEDEDEAEDEGDGAEDFGGAFGKNAEEPEDEEEAEPEADDAGGFGGAFGKKPPPEEPDDEEIEDDLDEQFANLPDIDTSRKVESDGPQGGPPPEGSFAAWGVEFVETLRIDWIDVLLRQLVILTSFLGAALATARGKHINVDALSKILPPWVRRWTNVATNLLAVCVCGILAWAGWKLVSLSREFPSELTPFFDEWHMQLMFPVGFGLLALHFTLRVTEAVLGLPGPGEEPPPPVVAKEDDA